MFAQLGDIIFETLTAPETLNFSEAPSFAEMATISGKPRLQRTGDQLQQGNLDVRLFNSLTSPEAAFAAMQAAMNAGLGLPLVFGNGRFIGTFVIASLDQDVLQTSPDGTVIEMVVRMQLKEFFQGDATQAAISAAVANGFANASNSPRVSNAALPAASPAAVITESLQASKQNTNQAIDAINKAQNQPSRAEALYRKAAKKVNQAKEGVTKAQRTLQTAQNLQNRAQSALSQMQLASRNLDRMQEALTPPISVSDLQTASRAAALSMGNMLTAASPITVISIIRSE